MRKHRLLLLGPPLAGMVALLLLLGGCGGGKPASTGDPIVFIGVDSADWHWIDPLMEEGRMPHFASLVERGVRAPLKSLVPLQKSPTIWTSIATGKRPAKHGIADFIRHDSKVETSEARTAAAYWEILGTLGRPQAVIGWWVTYPATAVNGVLVSDFLPYFEGGEQKAEGAVYPDTLWADLEGLRVRPEDVTPQELGRFVDLEIAAAHGEDAERLLADLRAIYAGDQTYRNVARHLYRPGAYQTFTVYFRGLDMVSHEYWQYFQTGVAPPAEESWETAMLDEVIPRYHEYVDEVVGEILAYIEPRARVVLCSDHGFAGHHRTARGMATGVEMHRETGILILAGPGLRRGAALEQAEVKDVMPTLLALSGVPLAQDLDGHLLGEALEPGLQKWCDELVLNAVPSYETIVPPRTVGGVEAPQAVNDEILEQLRSLGYIQ